jgi:ATP-binding cassette subfamily B protein RaxB
MDEATSNLDTKLELSVNTAVKSLDITRIIIAHRPETIASADRVIELRYGEAVEVDKSQFDARVTATHPSNSEVQKSALCIDNEEYIDTSAGADFILA